MCFCKIFVAAIDYENIIFTTKISRFTVYQFSLSSQSHLMLPSKSSGSPSYIK